MASSKSLPKQLRETISPRPSPTTPAITLHHCLTLLFPQRFLFHSQPPGRSLTALCLPKNNSQMQANLPRTRQPPVQIQLLLHLLQPTTRLALMKKATPVHKQPTLQTPDTRASSPPSDLPATTRTPIPAQSAPFPYLIPRTTLSSPSFPMQATTIIVITSRLLLSLPKSPMTTNSPVIPSTSGRGKTIPVSTQLCSPGLYFIFQQRPCRTSTAVTRILTMSTTSTSGPPSTTPL